MDPQVAFEQHEKHPQTGVNEEVWPLNLEMGSAALIEDGRSEMQAGETPAAEMMQEERDGIETGPILSDHNATAGCANSRPGAGG